MTREKKIYRLLTVTKENSWIYIGEIFLSYIIKGLTLAFLWMKRDKGKKQLLKGNSSAHIIRDLHYVVITLLLRKIKIIDWALMNTMLILFIWLLTNCVCERNKWGSTQSYSHNKDINWIKRLSKLIVFSCYWITSYN